MITARVAFTLHLGDRFKDGRYTVVHKLGRGGYATVWLVKDALTGAYASLKILVSSTPPELPTNPSEELAVLLRLHDSDEEGKEFVMQIIDYFEHEGPNGVHRCIVAEVLGPSLSADLEDVYPSECFPSDVAKRLVTQVGFGVKFLHSKGVVHGDLHLGNVLLYSPDFLSWSTQEDVENPPHIPRYYVRDPNPGPLLRLCLNHPNKIYIKICDFGESFFFDPSVPVQRVAHSPPEYMAPELLLDPKNHFPNPSTDIWALAILSYVIFTGAIHLRARNPVSQTNCFVGWSIASESFRNPIDPCPGRDGSCISTTTGILWVKKLR
ncbi:kinase-like domain-containing protein [Mycena capillaripes]|nr:kinase-like domain-containing protein [Mycena capillaripes]